MNWKSGFWMLFGILLGIGLGIFSGIIEELVDTGEYFLLVGGVILTVFVGLLSGIKYLPFASGLSGVITFQVVAVYYWGSDYGIEYFWVLPLLAAVYGVPWVFLNRIKSRKKGVKSTIDCPRCGNKIDKNWVSCPHCGMGIKDDTRVYDTPDDTQVY
ncbi:MAG: zinc ribbon domain-containing protein [Theionarchaea archaeon]|nr:MAG: hypothetical protein AYK19_17825 [Theionarchaea archaeon DG-70-1]MBU7025829.1 zinc ribbon domain-containing protein [Theionarchaea archaeon]